MGMRWGQQGALFDGIGVQRQTRRISDSSRRSQVANQEHSPGHRRAFKSANQRRCFNECDRPQLDVKIQRAVKTQAAECRERQMLQRQLFSLAGSQSGTPSVASLCCPLAGGAATTLCPPSRPPLSALSLSLSHSSPNISGFHNFFSLLFFGSPCSH